jgi:hypothetical protein
MTGIRELLFKVLWLVVSIWAGFLFTIPIIGVSLISLLTALALSGIIFYIGIKGKDRLREGVGY